MSAGRANLEYFLRTAYIILYVNNVSLLETRLPELRFGFVLALQI